MRRPNPARWCAGCWTCTSAGTKLVLVLDGPVRIGTRPLGAGVPPLSHRSAWCRKDLPTAAIRGCYVSRDPIRLLVVDKEPGGVADALNAGVNAAQYPVIGLVDRGGRFHPGASAALDSPHAGRLGPHGRGLRRGPPAPGAGSRGMYRRHRIAASVAGALCRLQRVEPPAAGSRRLHAGQTRGGLFGWRISRRSAGTLSGLARRRPRHGLAWRVAFLASPVSFRPAAGTWDDLHRQVLRDQRQLAAALRRTGAGGGREFFGLFCLRGLRPLLETAAYILAAAGWITGLVPPALAALVLVDQHRCGNRDLDGGRRAARTCRTQRHRAGSPRRPVPGRDSGESRLPADSQSLDDRRILRRSRAPKAEIAGARSQDRAPAIGKRSAANNRSDYRPVCSSKTNVVFVPPRRISLIDTLSPVPT